MTRSDDELQRDSPLHYEKNRRMIKKKINLDDELIKELNRLHILILESSKYIIRVQRMMRNQCSENQCESFKLLIKNIIRENNFKMLEKDEEKVINLILKKIKTSNEVTTKRINRDKLTHILSLFEKTFRYFQVIKKSLEGIFLRLQKNRINIIEQVRKINIKYEFGFSDPFINELITGFFRPI